MVNARHLHASRRADTVQFFDAGGSVTSQTFLQAQSIPSGTVGYRPNARGLCLWYEAVDVAKAVASQRYRIGNFVELVRGATAIAGRRFPSQLLGQVRTVCSLRPLVDPEFARALVPLRRAGIALIADYDDLIFAGRVDGLPQSVGGSLGGKIGAARLAAYAAGLEYFDRITVSTAALARHVARRSVKPVSIVPNALSENWVRHGHALHRAFHPGDPLVIRYLCGSPSHDADFASIAAPLAAFLRDHPQVSLDVVGPVRFNADIFPSTQLRRLPSVSYEELPRLLASSWVTLAPLLENAFNECKSAIKFLEAAAFACPTLTSPNDDLRRHQALGAPLVFCGSARDWYEQLSSLLDMERRREQGALAARHVAAHGMARQQLDCWIASFDLRGPN